MGNKMQALTEKQAAQLSNFAAFAVNFPGYEVLTFKAYKGPRYFYIVPVDSSDPWHDYRYTADNLEHINGYLYGAVQAACGQLRRA